MKRVTLIKGDGIGPEISEAVVRIIEASGAKIEWDIQTAGTDVIEAEGVPLPQRVLDSVKHNVQIKHAEAVTKKFLGPDYVQSILEQIKTSMPAKIFFS